jgi:hypothetical protein
MNWIDLAQDGDRWKVLVFSGVSLLTFRRNGHIFLLASCVLYSSILNDEAVRSFRKRVNF